MGYLLYDIFLRRGLRFQFFFLLLLLFVSIGFLKFAQVISENPGLDLDVPEVRVGKHSFFVDIADTAEERAQGLSGRDELEEGHGMLFLFDEPEAQGFWMKEMNFPIDILWIYEEWVIGIEREAPAPALGTLDSELPVYYSPGEVGMVLEINAGVAEELGIEVGDSVWIHNLE